MLIKLLNSYPALNEDGTAKKVSGTNRNLIMFRYTVHGSAEELAKYKEAQAEHYREDEAGKPLYFTSRPIGKTGKLEISQNGKIYIDTTDMDLAASLIDAHGQAGMLVAQQILGLKGSIQPAQQQRQSIEGMEPLD